MERISKVASEPKDSSVVHSEASIYHKIELTIEEDKIFIDLLAHRIQTYKDEPDRMTINYATALSAINNPSLGWFDEMVKLLDTIITTALRGWKGPKIDAVKTEIIQLG